MHAVNQDPVKRIVLLCHRITMGPFFKAFDTVDEGPEYREGPPPVRRTLCVE